MSLVETPDDVGSREHQKMEIIEHEFIFGPICNHSLIAFPAGSDNRSHISQEAHGKEKSDTCGRIATRQWNEIAGRLVLAPRKKTTQ